MVSNANDDYYCPRCGTSDNLQQTVKDIVITADSDITITSKVDMYKMEWYEFNCGVCKFKSIIGVTNE